MARGVTHLASGSYGCGSSSWVVNKELRNDSAKRRREYERMNRKVRMKNLENLIKK